MLLSAEKGRGLEVRGAFVRRGGSGPVLALTLANYSNAPMDGFMVQFNKNLYAAHSPSARHAHAHDTHKSGLTFSHARSYRLKPAKTLLDITAVGPGQTSDVLVPLSADGDEGPVSPAIHVAVKNNVDVFYFLAECPLNVFFSPDGALEKSAYLAAWKDIPNESERVQQLAPLVTADSNALTDLMQRHNIFLIAKRRVNDNEVPLPPP